jgi:hypothetical protein
VMFLDRSCWRRVFPSCEIYSSAIRALEIEYGGDLRKNQGGGDWGKGPGCGKAAECEPGIGKSWKAAERTAGQSPRDGAASRLPSAGCAVFPLFREIPK